MKEWKEYLFKVNGFEMTAVYNEDTIQKVFLPLLKQLQQLQKEKKEVISHGLYLQTHVLCARDSLGLSAQARGLLWAERPSNDEQDHGQHHPAVHNRSGVRRL